MSTASAGGPCGSGACRASARAPRRLGRTQVGDRRRSHGVALFDTGVGRRRRDRLRAQTRVRPPSDFAIRGEPVVGLEADDRPLGERSEAPVRRARRVAELTQSPLDRAHTPRSVRLRVPRPETHESRGPAQS